MRYKNNFLTQVVLRFDFASVPALLGAARPPDFCLRIKDRFPYQRSSQLMQISVNFPIVQQDAAAAPGMVQVPTTWMWHFGADEEFKKTVALSHNFLSLEYGTGKYSHSEEFLNTFRFISENFSDFIKNMELNRIGLRYINDIKLDEGSPLDWDGIIRPNYVSGVLAGLNEGMQLTRSMHQLAMIDDDISILLNYGILNQDFPNPVARRSFIVDLDVSLAGDIQTISLMDCVSKLNNKAEKLFESVVDDGLRKIMGIEDDEA